MGLRDLLLFLIVMSGSITALRYPFVGAMLWAWLSLMNPHRLTWGFMFDAPVVMIAALCTLVGMLSSAEKRSPWLGPPVVWFGVLIGWMVLTTAFAFFPGQSFTRFEKVLKVYVMIFVLLMLVRSKREIIVLAWVTALSVAFYGVKGGIHTLTAPTMARVYGPSGSFIQENNALAVALIMVVPLLRFLQMQLAKGWHKWMLTGAMALCGISILGSYSRGALLAISAMVTVLWWRGKNKVVTAVVLLIVAAIGLSTMPPEWWDRMASIKTYQEDQSAMGRINAWQMNLNIAMSNLFGGGFSIYNQWVYNRYAPDPSYVVSAHSIYFHIIGEHGFIGLFIFLGLWLSTWFTSGWLRKHGMRNPETVWCAQLGSMLQVALVGYAVGGAFLSLAYYDLPYVMMVLAVTTRVWVQSRAWEREPEFKPRWKLFGVPVFLGDRLKTSPSMAR